MGDDLERARVKWGYRGSQRPPFAIDPGPGEESVWDYPRPPRLDPDSREVRVLYRDTLVAQSARAVRVLETASPPVFYLPLEDVQTEHLARGEGASLCEWKGTASYWSLTVEGIEVPNVGWSYEQPFAGFEVIQDYLSFYPSKLECYVGEDRVLPQAGGS